MTESARQHDIAFRPPSPGATVCSVIKFPILTRISFYPGVNVWSGMNAFCIADGTGGYVEWRVRELLQFALNRTIWHIRCLCNMLF